MSAGMRAGLGHNQGPSLAPGQGFRRHAWGKARRALMPNTVPLEILRLRVNRAKALGLDYKSYASIRAGSGRDVLAFLVSSNGLGVRQGRVRPEMAERLVGLEDRALRLGAIYAPLTVPEGVLDHHSPAPGFTAGWSETRAKINALVQCAGVAPDGVVLVTTTTVEKEWCAAGKLGGMIPLDRFLGEKAEP